MILKSFRVKGYQAIILLILPLGATYGFTQNQLTFTPFKVSGIYNSSEAAGWNIRSIPNATCLQFNYVVKENNMAIVKSGHLDMSSGSGRIQVEMNEPAMVLVDVVPDCKSGSQAETGEAEAGNRQPVPEAVLGAAIAPTGLKPSVDRPADFDVFWQVHLKKLASIPIDPELTPIPSESAAVDLYTVKLNSVDSHVQGYLAKPSKPGKYPALIMFQYAGVYALKTEGAVKHAEAGWLTLDVDSHDLPPATGTGVPADYYTIGNHDREKSYFLNMYLRDTRAVDYITTCPEWDGKTIVLVGTSMGGQQSLVTAGLNPSRITAVIVNEPSGADTNGNLHGRKAGYPYWDSSDAEVMKTSLYFDPVNFAPLIKAPTIISAGFIDTTAPPAGLWTVFNQISAPKEMVPMIESGHSNGTPNKQTTFTKRSDEALEILLHSGHLEIASEPLEPGTK